jgi:uncharacterized membrane protein
MIASHLGKVGGLLAILVPPYREVIPTGRDAYGQVHLQDGGRAMTNLSAMREAKRPRSIFAGPYGHPIHGLLVTIPIGAWVASFIFDLASMLSDDTATFARGAAWLIAIGLVGAALAAIAGLLDLTKIASGTRARVIVLAHMGINLAVIALFFVGFLIRINQGYDEVGIGAFILSLVALALLSVSGYLGGELAYRMGVRVADETTQADYFN